MKLSALTHGDDVEYSRVVPGALYDNACERAASLRLVLVEAGDSIGDKPPAQRCRCTTTVLPHKIHRKLETPKLQGYQCE